MKKLIASTLAFFLIVSAGAQQQTGKTYRYTHAFTETSVQGPGGMRMRDFKHKDTSGAITLFPSQIIRQNDSEVVVRVIVKNGMGFTIYKLAD